MKIITILFLALPFLGASQSFDFFQKTDEFLHTHSANGKMDYKAIQSDPTFPKLMSYIAENESPAGKEKAYLINAYNLFVIDKVVKAYPMNSPMDDGGFFTDKDNLLNGKNISLDYLENGVLRKEHADPRLHFVLVCGAIGCPPITNFAYTPEKLDEQLERQTKIALNNDAFVYEKKGEKTVYLSEIFSWYTEDFGKNMKEVVQYINGYRTTPFDETFKVRHYPYNWTLNDKTKVSKPTMNKGEEAPLDQATNLQQFTAGSLLGRGKMDFTLFNTLYTENKNDWMGQEFSGYRATFVTHLLQYTIGVSKNKRINLGVDLNFRSSGRSSDSTFAGVSQAFAYKNHDSSRVGLTSVGLRVKIQPFKSVQDFSIQSTFMMPTVVAPEGRPADASQGVSGLYWADWDRYTWWNQIFYSKTFGKFQLFTELDLLFRFRRNKSQIGMLDMPVSAFFSYFPTKKITVYAMTQHVHRFTNNITPNDPVVTDWVVPSSYTASGLGFKYQFLPNLNVELLYTNFWRGRNSGLGQTFNLGIKFLTK